MPVNGFGWEVRKQRPSSDEIAESQKQYHYHAIECFGVNRCMFESNFPVEKVSVSYPVLWNAFKKIALNFSETEKHELFYGTAKRIYGLSTET